MTKGTRYHFWHGLGFYALMGDEVACLSSSPAEDHKGVEMLEEASHLHYNDAQDMMMFGILQYEPAKLLPVLRRILTHWEREGNIEMVSSGTGALKGESLLALSRLHHL